MFTETCVLLDVLAEKWLDSVPLGQRQHREDSREAGLSLIHGSAAA